MNLDIFTEINNAVLDLQSAQLQTYERPLKKLAQLLKHPDLEPFNIELRAGQDLDAFMRESEQTAGLMVGSAKLVWPDDPEVVRGLTLLLIEKMAGDSRFTTNFSVNFFYSNRKIIDSIHAVNAQLITPFVQDYRSYVLSKSSFKIALKQALSQKIFIVHGHDEGSRETVARFLERMGLEPIILHEQANQGRTVIEKVIANGDVGFAVVLLTPDDQGCAKDGKLEPRARQNVLLELGYFIGRLGRDKVCALKRGVLEIPSDFAGVVWTAMDENSGWKLALARELAAAGYDIDMNRIIGA